MEVVHSAIAPIWCGTPADAGRGERAGGSLCHWRRVPSGSGRRLTSYGLLPGRSWLEPGVSTIKAMRILSGQRLTAGLAWGFGTILVLLLTLAGLSVVRMNELTSTLEDISVRNAERLSAVGLPARGVSNSVQELGDFGATDLNGAAAVLVKIQATLGDYDAEQSKLVGLMPKNERAQLLVQTIGHQSSKARELIALAEKLPDGRGATTKQRNPFGQWAVLRRQFHCQPRW